MTDDESRSLPAWMGPEEGALDHVGESRLVRRYPNRRMYDTVARRYVALEEIAAAVDRGDRVRVVEAKGGADVTREVLLPLLVQRWSKRFVGDEGIDQLCALLRESKHAPAPTPRGKLESTPSIPMVAPTAIAPATGRTMEERMAALESLVAALAKK